MMRTAKAVALLGALGMGTALIYGFTVGDFSAEGSLLLSIPWGIISLVDVYVMFMLFSGWIVFREKSPLRSLAWILAIVILGAFVASLYTLVALFASKGDWRRFWMGNRGSD